jgi:hypothetical protein
VVSLLIFAIFVSTETYFLSLMINYVRQLNVYSMVLMGFMIIYSPLFLVIGSFIINSSLRNKYLLVILALVSIIPSCAYPFISGTTYDELSILVLCVGPFTCVFWMLLRSIRVYQRILFLYIFFYIPVVLLTLNELELFTTDTSVQSIIRITGIAVMAAAVFVVLTYLIVIGAISAYRFVT